MNVIDLGLIGYDEAYELQMELLRKRRLGLCEDTLIFLEHRPVITLGRSAKKEHLLLSEEALREKGIEIRKVDRGGDITYHGIGQLVCYSMVDLKERALGIYDYLRILEEAVMCALGEFGINGKRAGGLTGVWVKGEKIASIGIGVKGWVSYHGVCVNVSPNWEHLNYIVPCGLQEKKTTSMERVLGSKVDIESLKAAIARGFEDVFAGSKRAPQVAYA
ncbi:MAG: lipoyl(octanoyl) transferase LipB [Candidatus Omnitrophica bacterium]|nr:lipoyl(octanoyl) transferase LipB [Candidatus Omnitrophota bacterium]